MAQLFHVSEFQLSQKNSRSTWLVTDSKVILFKSEGDVNFITEHILLK